jgi:hypothetical protein
MKALARFTKVELEPYEVDGYQDFPRLRTGNDTSTELARYLGMKEIDFQQAGDPTQYKIYSVTVSAYLLRDGSLEVEGIDADEGLPKERIEAFFRNGKFQTRELPSVFEKFRVGTLDEGAIFYFRKSDKRLARRERETEREQEQRLELGASAVLDANRLVHMDEAGHIRVWRTNDGSFDPAATAEFARQDLVRIASDGAQLWALGTSQVYRWSPQDRSWKRAARFDLKRNPVKAFAVAGGAPFLILESGLVVNALAGRTYRTPAEDQFELMKMEAELEIAPDVDGSERKSYPERFMPFMPFGAPLRYTVSALGTDSRLWIGTSRGEWGGALYGLDPANGTWVDHGDSLAYVTGMTVDQSGQLIVSWSMNHMGSADTKILRHGPDAAPLRAISDSGARYYQTVAYNPFDNTNGGHTVLAELDGPIYGRERMAVGVAPGVRSLLPMASGAMAIVPKTGMPWLLRNGKLTRLQEPGSGN